MKKTIIMLLAVVVSGIASAEAQVQDIRFPSIEITGTSTINIDPSSNPNPDGLYWEAMESALEDVKEKADFIGPYFGSGELYPWMVVENDPEDFIGDIQLPKNAATPHQPFHRRYSVKVVFIIQ